MKEGVAGKDTAKNENGVLGFLCHPDQYQHCRKDERNFHFSDKGPDNRIDFGGRYPRRNHEEVLNQRHPGDRQMPKRIRPFAQAIKAARREHDATQEEGDEDSNPIGGIQSSDPANKEWRNVNSFWRLPRIRQRQHKSAQEKKHHYRGESVPKRPHKRRCEKMANGVIGRHQAKSMRQEHRKSGQTAQSIELLQPWCRRILIAHSAAPNRIGV